MELVLTNQGISAIAAALARTIGYPLVVQDLQAQVLAGVEADGQPSTTVRPLTRDILAQFPFTPAKTSSQVTILPCSLSCN